MTGWKKTTSALLISITVLSIPSALVLASPGPARAASLSTRLTHARRELRHAGARLRRDRQAYAAALAAAGAASADTAVTPSPTPTPGDSPTAVPSAAPSATPAPTLAPTLAQLRHAVAADKHRVRVWRVRVVRLAHELALRRAAAHGNWMPIVREAAQRNHISAIGLRRLMSLESGGRVHAENGSFHGLYQYCWSTWRAAWNPWRASSLYDGEAQIRATAVAIRRGWGPQMWPNTYPRAF